jgi:hypothetical protein
MKYLLTLLTLLSLLSLCVQTMRAQIVEIWPNGQTTSVIQKVNYGAVIPDWRIDSIHTETLATNSLAITHRVNQTTIPTKGAPVTTAVYENRWYYSRVGPGVWAPLYGEHVVFNTLNDPPLTWFPTISGTKTEGNNFWRTETSASTVELKIISRWNQNALVRIGCWWDTDSPTVNGFGQMQVIVPANQTVVSYLGASQFTTLLHPVNFIGFDVDNYSIEPAP